MKIDSENIIRTAQQIRDEENIQQTIRPWNRHRSHFRIPSWLVAIPAAVFLGFILGIWTKSSNQQDAPLTAMVDTVYIKVPTPAPAPVLQETPAVQPAVAQQAAIQKRSPRKAAAQKKATGCPVAEDHIRYDLLVRN
ncbi:hypothetical protein [Prevotella sp. E2-28]|uniref:hypothetical protein n=1 Tax=Prevotella sp. E2-28 TaxID=2913620 RepID=UPI001EDBA8FA|nr:hypothetical protein [Prevotella sp. E2-28]UKK53957.1 hypothetical protein L6465_01430 [Prevotella sp. E2-28]